MTDTDTVTVTQIYSPSGPWASPLAAFALLIVSEVPQASGERQKMEMPRELSPETLKSRSCLCHHFQLPVPLSAHN